MLTLLISFALLFTLGSTSPLANHLKSVNETYNIHAVLIAGSNVIYNYRHQADVCHAYHVLRDHGVPAENIITLMYDDIANNEDNPIPGKIYNIPDGPDVYEGVIIDYKGDDVNTENFLGVLKGDKSLAAKGKKVLTSGPNDHVFIYYSDHGATGILGMPYGMLTSKDLNDAIVYMNHNKLYGKLTMYVEACSAGSMFENILPDNINAFATTASNPTESSYAAFCHCSGPLDGMCLGDEYSVAWLQDSDKQDLKTETLQQQFENVVKNTVQSHPQEYGQKSLGSLEVGQFQGEKTSSINSHKKSVSSFGQVDSRDVPLYSLRTKIIASNDANKVAVAKKELSNMIAGRQYLKQTINKVITSLCSAGFCSSASHVLNTRKPLTNHIAHDKVVKTFHSKCINLGTNTDAMKYVYALANIIEEAKFTDASLESFLKTLTKSCEQHFANNQFQAIV